MAETQAPRGFWSTLVISIFTNGMGGLLWIGRPRLAFALFVALVVFLYAVLAGWLPLPRLLSPTILAGIIIAITSAIPLLLRSKSLPKTWMAKLLPAIIIPIFLSGLAAISIRSLAYQPFSIPAESMMPTLLVGDNVVANKSIYGYSKFSFPLGLATFSGRTSGALPERGDIIMFDNVVAVYVKRIIGMPGETIQMIDGVPVINDTPLKQEFIAEYLLGDAGRMAKEVRETLPNGRSYSILDLETGSIGDDTREYVIPQGHYFVLGDHRDNSIDSRFDMGFVELESLIGRADRIYANTEGLEFVSRKNLNGN